MKALSPLRRPSWTPCPCIPSSTPVWPWAEKKLPQGAAGQILRTAVYTLVFVVSVSYLAMGSHNPFIYFNF